MNAVTKENARARVATLKNSTKAEVTKTWLRYFGGKVNTGQSGIQKSWMIYDIIRQEYGVQNANEVA